jgi:hypothetical protein
MMEAPPRKRPKGERRELAPLEPVDAKLGPKMLGLPSDRHRAYVESLFIVRPGHGAAVRAARMAGFGTPTSSAQSLATISSRLMHDDRVLDAIREYSEKFIRTTTPAALHALRKLIATPGHKDHARGIAMVMDREHPVETVVKVNHDATPAFRATAEVLARIAELAARAGVDVSKLPPMIDVTPASKSERPA